MPLLGLSFSSTDGDSHTCSLVGAGPGEASSGKGCCRHKALDWKGDHEALACLPGARDQGPRRAFPGAAHPHWPPGHLFPRGLPTRQQAQRRLHGPGLLVAAFVGLASWPLPTPQEASHQPWAQQVALSLVLPAPSCRGPVAVDRG